MLNADLAEIYGYSTKDFNRHVKNNIERFAEDFRFQLTKREVEELRSKKNLPQLQMQITLKICGAKIAPDVSAGMVALATQTSLNTRDIAEIATDVRTLSNKVERNESFLQKVMANFINPSTFKHFLIVDDFLNVKTLRAKTFYF